MKPKKRYSVWVKSILAVVFVISLTIAVVSGALFLTGQEMGAFHLPFEESDIANTLARRGPRGMPYLTIDDDISADSGALKTYIDESNQTMLDIYTYYQYLNHQSDTATRSQTPAYYETLYAYTNLRARVVMTDAQGNVTSTVCALGDPWDEDTILLDRMRDPNSEQPMWFEIGFHKYLQKVGDPLGQTARFYHRLAANGDFLILCMSMGIGVLLLTGGLLLMTAGHRVNDPDIHLRLFDRWALGIVLSILTAIWLTVYLMAEHYYYSADWWLNYQVKCIMMMPIIESAVLLGALALRTIVVRSKAHRLWNTTLCYYVCAPLMKAIRRHREEKRTASQETLPLIAETGYSDGAWAEVSLQEGKQKGFAQKTKDGMQQAVRHAKDFEWKGSRVQGLFKGFWSGCRAWAGRMRRSFSQMDIVALGMLCGAGMVMLYLIFGLIEWDEDRLMAMSLFSVLVLIGLFWIVRQIAVLQAGAQRLAAGDLMHTVDTRHLHGPFRMYAEYLNNISSGMMMEVERRMKSEHLKTELLTNVSHDIKTPLTSIINYVDLMKKLDVQPEEAKEYADVLERQSYRLKKLLEDLIEASKAATGNITVELAPTDAAELLRQAEGEYNERLKEQELTPVLHIDAESCSILADGRLLWRVFDNLLGNIVKYAMPGTRVYLELSQQGQRCFITIRNISRDALGIEAEELMERFVRGDISRATEGSGLGLSIARSLTECMNGGFDLVLDGDLFKVVLDFPLV